jgi:DNA polymerase I-like protein with 3'-5' exonuclease and polymerase domains
MRSLDMPLMRVLAGMEAAGVALDLAVLGAQKLPLLKQLGRLMVRTAVALK